MGLVSKLWSWIEPTAFKTDECHVHIYYVVMCVMYQGVGFI